MPQLKVVTEWFIPTVLLYLYYQIWAASWNNYLFPPAGTSTSILQPGQPGLGDCFQEWECEIGCFFYLDNWSSILLHHHTLCSLSTGKCDAENMAAWYRPVILNVVSHPPMILLIWNLSCILSSLSWRALELYNNGVLLIEVMVDNLVLSPDLTTDGQTLSRKHCTLHICYFCDG